MSLPRGSKDSAGEAPTLGRSPRGVGKMGTQSTLPPPPPPLLHKARTGLSLTQQPANCVSLCTHRI